jgi:hypothetical protein
LDNSDSVLDKPSPRLERYKRSVDLNFHHEKIALIRLAQHLLGSGWTEVRLSVPPQDIRADRLGGLDAADLDGVDMSSSGLFDDEFRRRFNEHLTFRYDFYGDSPGGVDLVARSRDGLLLVEAKGQSRRDRKGGVYELIGRQVALRSDDDDRRFAILIPDTWRPVLPPWRPSLDWLTVFLIERETGAIEETKLPR